MKDLGQMLGTQIGKLVHPEQTGFIPHNILSLDADQVEWSYLLAFLKKK